MTVQPDPQPTYIDGLPRFNHVAISVPAAVLSPAGRAQLLEVYGDVFGMAELPTMTDDDHRLVMSVGHWDQFVFLIADDQPMVAPRLDHYGLSVSSRRDFDACWERAQVAATTHEGVDLIAPSSEDHGPVILHSFYMGYVLPMMIEIQYWEFT